MAIKKTTKKRKVSKKKSMNSEYKGFMGDLIEEIAGKPGRDVFDILLSKSNVNEFLIAKKLDLTINQTRNILYRLSDNRIVSFTRKKDKRKGWYTYFWSLNIVKTLEFAEKKILEHLKRLNNIKKSRESRRFYRCQLCVLEVSEETALMNNFTCTECGSVYELSESANLISDVESKIKSFHEELKVVEESLVNERKKIGKRINAKNSREKVKKKKLRKERAVKRAAERKKDGTGVKKVAKKKVKKASKKVAKKKTTKKAIVKKVAKKRK